MLPAAWPQSADSAESGCRRSPAVSLPQRQPPIPDPTSAPNIYPLLLLPSCPLEHSALSWSRGGAAGGGSLLHEAGHGSVYVCGAPRSALSLLGRWKSRCTCNKSSAGPPPGLTLHHSQAGSRSRIRASSCCVQAAAQRALTEGAGLRCPLPGTELCIAPSVLVHGGAQRVHVTASLPSSWRGNEERQEEGREGMSTAKCLVTRR